MANKQLKFTRQTNMFGTTITLSSKDGTYNEIITEGFGPQDPLRNHDTKIKTGYLFRSPGIKQSDWSSTFNSLHNVDGKFNLTAVLDDTDENNKIVTSLVRFADQSDAALFAWSQVSTWQKWSDALEKEAKVDARRKPKVKVGKDGKITIKTTVTTLGK
jgi:hypothetical protein